MWQELMRATGTGLATHELSPHLSGMIFTAAKNALGELFDPALRQVFWKSIGLTIAGLIAVWFGLKALFEAMAIPFVSAWIAGLGMPAMPEWTGTLGLVAAVAAGLGLAAGLAFLIGPVSAAIAGIFLDDVADHVERQDYPADPPGTAMAIAPSIWMSIKFFGIVIVGNLLALALLLVPGINLIAFFAVNGYLLGREYFQFAAMRFRDEKSAALLRSKYSSTVILAGFLIAGFLAIPVVNLLTPLFGAALMVHLHKAIEKREQGSTIRAAA